MAVKGIGIAIRRARLAAGLSQDQLADAIGVRRPTVSNWERGLNSPTPNNLEDVARALGLSAETLEGLAYAAPTGSSARVRETPDLSGFGAITPLTPPKPTPRIPPRAYQLVFEYSQRLEQAGVPEDAVDEARRLMSGQTFNTLRAGTRDDRTEEGWVKDVKAAWAFIRDTLKAKGYEL